MLGSIAAVALLAIDISWKYFRFLLIHCMIFCGRGVMLKNRSAIYIGLSDFFKWRRIFDKFGLKIMSWSHVISFESFVEVVCSNLIEHELMRSHSEPIQSISGQQGIVYT